MPLGGIDSSFYQPLKTFKTKYYSFEAEKEWNFVPKESSQSVFVYRQSHKNIVMSDLKIYVNSLPGDLLLTNILPVKPAGDQFNTDQISPHCKEALPKNYLLTNRNPKNVVFKGVSFKCWSDGTLPVVGTGLYGGSYQSELEGKKSGKNKFFLIYNDRQYNQTLFKFQNIVESFKAL